MNKTPWFMAGGARPALALDGANQWHFGSNDAKALSISVDAYFAFFITPDQVSIVNDMINNGVDVSGSFETWADFCQSHGVSGGAN